jgi:hypothetical protein
MAKKSIENVVEAGEFFGSFQKLKMLTSSQAGRWRDKGIAKVFVGDDGDDIIWWPDTGDVLQVYHAEPCRGARGTAVWDRIRRNGSGLRSGRWKIFEHAKLGKVSLPELVFRNPWFFLEKLSHRSYVPEGTDKAEIDEKISAIRIPASVPPKSHVIHKFTARGYVYEGFTVSAVPIERTRQRGFAVVDDRISLCWLTQGTKEKVGNKPRLLLYHANWNPIWRLSGTARSAKRSLTMTQISCWRPANGQCIGQEVRRSSAVTKLRMLGEKGPHITSLGRSLPSYRRKSGWLRAYNEVFRRPVCCSMGPLSDRKREGWI